MKNHIILFFTVILFNISCFSQRILTEDITFYDVILPNKTLDENVTTYSVVVKTPYTLTAEDAKRISLEKFEEEKNNYQNLVAKSKLEYEEKLNNHDEEVAKAKEVYETEMADFKSLSMLERLALTDQGKKPTLKLPAKPQYVEPREPIYREPNLDDYLIFDNKVLADKINLNGFEKGTDLTLVVNISKMTFQDNGGETFYSQPFNIKALKGTENIYDKTFGEEFQFLSSSASNTINLDRYEKQNVNKIIDQINTSINEEYGYTSILSKIVINYPKNKDREFDALENSKNKAISAFRKLTENVSQEKRTRAYKELEDVRNTWLSELEKVDYSNKKATFNAKIGKSILFNLLRVDVILKDKDNAEEILAKMQESRIDLDLNYNEEKEFTSLEEKVYQL